MWITKGKEWGEILKELTDSSFTSAETGIRSASTSCPLAPLVRAPTLAFIHKFRYGAGYRNGYRLQSAGGIRHPQRSGGSLPCRALRW